MKTVFEHSAGGGVLTLDGRLVLVGTRNLRGDPVVTLPKGLLKRGEQAIEVARREVTGETGFEVEELGGNPLDTLQYWYGRDGVRVRKRVEFLVGGDPERHDGEIDEVLAVETGRAVDLLSYPSERRLVRKALVR